jgi:dimethylamine/trimethylamine dehydrogenase
MSSYRRVTDYRTNQIQQLPNVNVFLENELQSKDVLDLGFDHVLTATGSTWELSILDEHFVPQSIDKQEGLFTPDDILKGCELQSPVVIYDFDYYYMGGLIAEYISDRGHEVTIITPFENISPWSFMSNEVNAIKATMHKKNIKTITEHRISEFKNESLSLTHKVTKEVMDVDRKSLVIVGMRLPDDSLYQKLNANQPLLEDSGIKTLKNIGDSNAPGAVFHAVYAGHMYANTFDSKVDESSLEFKFEYPVIQ